MKSIAPLFAFLLLAVSSTDAEVAYHKTPDGIEFGTWGPEAGSKAPTLFILAADIEKTLSSSYFRQCGNALSELGFLCVSIDIPAHGKRSRDAEKSGLTGWRLLADSNEDFVLHNNQRLSSILDHLIKSDLTDPKRVAACGTSRGGFLAMHFAAHEPRIGAVAAFAPVTDLLALSEFAGAENNTLVEKRDLKSVAAKLAGRPVWIAIGDQDMRVSTESAYETAAAITAASKQNKTDSKIELHILPEPRGHTTPKGSPEMAATWIAKQLLPVEGEAATHPSYKEVVEVPELPRVLLIGDSISMGYTPGVQKRLKKIANVHRPKANCGPTLSGLKYLDQWLREERWDLIHFNWGLHDVMHYKGGSSREFRVAHTVEGAHRRCSPEEYEANLQTLVTRLRKTGAQLIWASTTPIPDGLSHMWKPGDAGIYNTVAEKVMRENNIPINDLHAFARPRLSEIQKTQDVHFTEGGSEVLAEEVSRVISDALKQHFPAK